MASRANHLRRLQELGAALPAASLQQLLDYATYLFSREEWEATQELLSDPGMRADVLEGREQARRGEVRPWRQAQAARYSRFRA